MGICEGGGIGNTLSVQVRRVAGEPYDRIIGHTLGEKPPAMAAGDLAGPEPEYVPAISDDDIPF